MSNESKAKLAFGTHFRIKMANGEYKDIDEASFIGWKGRTRDDGGRVTIIIYHIGCEQEFMLERSLERKEKLEFEITSPTLTVMRHRMTGLVISVDATYPLDRWMEKTYVIQMSDVTLVEQENI